MNDEQLTLILVPTEMERRLLDLDKGGLPKNTRLATCGFGPLSAALNTQRILREHNPSRVLLAGIAGSYELPTPIGQVFAVRRTQLDGIGIRVDGRLVPPAETGFDTSFPTIFESLETPPEVDSRELLLTVCEPSNHPEQAAQRQRQYPSATLEDMEGYGVAAACDMMSVPLTILRAVSNQAGDRDLNHWAIRPSLIALRESLITVLES